MKYNRIAFRHKNDYYCDRENNKYLVNAFIPRYILASYPCFWLRQIHFTRPCNLQCTLYCRPTPSPGPPGPPFVVQAHPIKHVPVFSNLDTLKLDLQSI